MNLKAFLLFSAALFVWIVASRVYMLLYYWSALLVCVSFLNTRKRFKQQPYKWVNLLFFLYMLFIVWERTRHYKFGALTELIINDAEHIFFAVIISLLIALLLTLSFTNTNSYAKTIVITIVIFNIVGVLNELFQNTIAGRPVFILIPDSQKDILMNLCGSTLFAAISLLWVKNLPKARRL